MSTLVSTAVSSAHLREFHYGRTIAAMSHSEASARSRTRINVLKKVKVHGQWKLCPVVIETSGRLKDRVRVKGRTELHSEGVYYIEWRENNQRRRQAIPNRTEVLEYARLKGLELDARKAGNRSGGVTARGSADRTHNKCESDDPTTGLD